MDDEAEGTAARRRRRRRPTAAPVPGPEVAPGAARPESQRPESQRPEPQRPEPQRTEPKPRRPRPAHDGGERGLRDIVGAGPSQVGVNGALRARDVNRPTEADLAEAEATLVVVRRNWQPPDGRK